MTFHITGPEGALLTETATLEKTQAQMFRAMGKRLSAAAWPPGPYIGRVTLIRQGQTIDETSVSVEIQ